MPQITLEYTENVASQSSFADIFQRIHSVLTEVCGASLEDCKSRAVERDKFCIGDDPRGGFVHLDVKILEGRSEELKKKLGLCLLEILEKVYAQTDPALPLQLTVEVNNIKRAEFFKYSR